MINIKQWKFKSDDIKTHMEEQYFYNSIDNEYKKLYNNTLPTKYILTNGANGEFKSGGAGTNSAITELGKQVNNNENLFFYQNNINLIFNSCDEDIPILKNIIDNDNQKIKFIDEYYCAGSVFLSNPLETDENKDKTIYEKKIKVFHIKGINWKLVDNKNIEKNSIDLVKAYYKSILDYFFDKENDDEVLHLVQTPGAIFGGTKHTTKGLFNAIKDKFNEINKKNISFKNNKLLTVDIDNYNYLSYIDDIIKKINKTEKHTNNKTKFNKTKKNKKTSGITLEILKKIKEKICNNV